MVDLISYKQWYSWVICVLNPRERAGRNVVIEFKDLQILCVPDNADHI